MSQLTEWLEKEKQTAEAAYAKAVAALKQAEANVHHLEGRLTALIHTLEAAPRDQPEELPHQTEKLKTPKPHGLSP